AWRENHRNALRRSRQAVMRVTGLQLYRRSSATEISLLTAQLISFNPLDLTTFAHFAISARRKTANSCGELTTGSLPVFISVSFTSGLVNARRDSTNSRCTMSAEVPAGAYKPYQPVTS